MPHPNNTHTPSNPVGRFMVAVGAVIVQANSNNILLVQRAADLDWHAGEWEIPYGRLAQLEDPLTGLQRELSEEIGLTEFHVRQILTNWHIFRGDETAENELIGITYLLETAQQTFHLSDEHQASRWVTPQEALTLIKVDGIRRDILAYNDVLHASHCQVGKDVIGVGAGAVILNSEGKVLLSLRGKKAKNEVGKWEIPGGAIELGETIEAGLIREVKEEIGVEIRVVKLLQLADHILPDEHQHWVSPTYLCEIVSGTPHIQEPEKSDALEWFTVEEALQLPLAQITRKDIERLASMHS